MESYRPEVYLSEQAIGQKVQEMAEKITTDYANEELVVVCVLKGSFVFCSDLIKKINLPLKLEFMQVSSYKEGTVSSGECQLLLDLTGSIEHKNVLVVEDIVDTGNTIHYLMKQLKTRNPNSLKLASLLYKPNRLKYDVAIDYLAFTIEDKFVVGYGLDYAERYRELPYVGVLNTGI